MQPSLVKQSIAYGLGAVGKDLIFNLTAMFYIAHAVQVLGIAPLTAAFIYAGVRIIDALTDPLMGYLADAVRNRLFNYQSCIFGGAVLSGILGVLLFVPYPFDPTVNAVLSALCFLLFTIAYSVNDVPYWATIASFGSDARVRDLMSAVPRSGALIGQQLMIFTCPFLAGSLEPFTIVPYAVICALIFALLEALMLTQVKEPRILRPQKLDFKSAVTCLRANDALKTAALIMLLQQILYALGAVAILTRLSGGEETLKGIVLSGAICQLIAYLTLPWLNRLFSRRAVFCTSAIMIAAAAAGLCFLTSDLSFYLEAFALLYCVFSTGIALSLVQTSVMTADCVDYGEFKTGLRTANLAFSLQTTCAKLGIAVNTLLSVFLVSTTAMLPERYTQTAYEELSLYLPLLLTALLAILMMVIYLKFSKLNSVFFKSTLTAVERLRNLSDSKSNPIVVRYALQRDLICCRLDEKKEIQSPLDIIHELCLKLENSGTIEDADSFELDVKKRLAAGPCGIADGIAIPHAKSAQVILPAIAVATTTRTYDCGAPDGRPCDLFFLIASPEDGDIHLNLLGRLSLMLNERGFTHKLREAVSEEEIHERLIQTSLSICAKPRNY